MTSTPRWLLLALVVHAAAHEMKLHPMPAIKNMRGTSGAHLVPGQFAGLHTILESNYFINVTVGIERSVFQVVFDTGSSDLAVPLKGCQDVRAGPSGAPITNPNCGTQGLNGMSSSFKLRQCALFNETSAAGYTCRNGLTLSEALAPCRHPGAPAGCMEFATLIYDFLNGEFPGCDAAPFGLANACGLADFYGLGIIVYGFLAVLTQDLVVLPGFDTSDPGINMTKLMNTPVTFGAIGKEIGNLFGDNKGIMGMSFQGNSGWNMSNTFLQIAEYNNIPAKFALCVGADGGMADLGGDGARVSDGQHVTVPVIKAPTPQYHGSPKDEYAFWRIAPKEFRLDVGGKVHTLPIKLDDEAQAFLDSGTPGISISWSSCMWLKDMFTPMCSELIWETPYGAGSNGSNCQIQCMPKPSMENRIPSLSLTIDNTDGKEVMLPLWQYVQITPATMMKQGAPMWWNFTLMASCSTTPCQMGTAVETLILGTGFLQSYLTVFDMSAKTITLNGLDPTNSADCGGTLSTANFAPVGTGPMTMSPRPHHSHSKKNVAKLWYFWVPLIGGILLIVGVAFFIRQRSKDDRRNTEMRSLQESLVQ